MFGKQIGGADPPRGFRSRVNRFASQGCDLVQSGSNCPRSESEILAVGAEQMMAFGNAVKTFPNVMGQIKKLNPDAIAVDAGIEATADDGARTNKVPHFASRMRIFDRGLKNSEKFDGRIEFDLQAERTNPHLVGLGDGGRG